MRADRDHRNAWPQGRELVGESLIGGAVVGDFKDLDRPEWEHTGDLRFRIARQEQIDSAIAREHDRAMDMWVLVRRARVVGPEDAQLQATKSVDVAKPRGHERHAELECGCTKSAFVEGTTRMGRIRLQRVDHRADVEVAEHSRRPADVVAMIVRDDERGERT